MALDTPSPDPIARFHETYARARAADADWYNAMSFSTVGDDGRPSARMVLLKGADRDGFVTYTNLRSRKGREALAHPFAALVFHWTALQEQVRVEGRVERVSEAEADAYFATRPRGSQIGAWASHQSEVLDHRSTLLKRVADYEREFHGRDVPRPPHWSGLRIVPDRIEFWHGQPSRLHDRTLYTLGPDGWRVQVLNP
jgi:pyridoxamine 5'-phosphate oxidase